MRGAAAGEHAGSVTWFGAARRTPHDAAGAVAAAADGGAPVPDEVALAIAQAEVAAIEAVGGFAGGVYMRSSTPGLLRLAVVAGLPTQLFRPWTRMHVNRPFPLSDVYRSGQPVFLGDAEESMRRYPQLMAGLPFPFGSLYVPIISEHEKFGVMAVLRPATPGVPIDQADRAQMIGTGKGLGAMLTAIGEKGSRVEWDGEAVAVTLPVRTAPPVQVGRFDWNIDTGAVLADEGLCAILGMDPAEFPGTVWALAERLAPEDAYGLWAIARQAAESDRPVSRRMRLNGPDGRPHVLEVSGRRVDPPAGAEGIRLTGLLVDLGTTPVVSQAADRLPQGVFTLDRLGRITYVNRNAEKLLGHARDELVGRVLWDALPWLGQAGHDDHYRAALMTRDPVRFQTRTPSGTWLSASLHSGREGLTVELEGQEPPAYTPESVIVPGLGLGSTADRAVALYRPVALAIALTEAVTARQVSAVVTEELLPAFGGRQLAIYLLNERHLYLAWETGFPRGFLDRFDGVSMEAQLPGVETLTSGRPIFFESMQRLADAYPGIPLDASVGARAFLPLIASGRPVGSCILGFDHPRGFSPEERTVLTALAGLIAQALERAQRYDSEAALARGLQNALLPHRLPVVEHFDTVGRYLPGTQGMEVGGDWYDVIETGRGLALVIGDVQGHGVAAAATMGQLRSAVRAFALSGFEPREVMSGTNRLLIDLDPGQFASCCYVTLDPGTGLAQAVRAGHLQPLLRHPDGSTEVLNLAGGVVLGVDGMASYPIAELQLEPGALLALYTDGLVEQPGADIDLGIERLRGALADMSTYTLAETADRLINEARQEVDRPDDIALLLGARWPRRDPGHE
ncbi:SpoIIE family protein phosphatase [Streptomyces sp. NPDC058572]|uniref:SpoIIE family protein phosphatase n=1 Tax=Streptomyces sp. NPDC058572 TaxID=3346546 RepID=UPI00365800F1